MKRKLINYDVFESIQNNSLTAAEFELTEAEPYLARALETEALSLLSFTQEAALYETVDGEFVHTNYQIAENSIQFDNIEQLAIDEDTEKSKRRELISHMLDSILETKTEKANQIFESYLNMPSTERMLKESFKISASHSSGHGRKSKFRGKTRAGGHAAAMKAARTRKRNDKVTTPSMKKKIERMRDVENKKLGGRDLKTDKGERSVRTYIRRGGKKLQEWTSLVNNVLGYVAHQEIGPVLRESEVSHDDKGNIVAVRIPTHDVRNEQKLLSFDWKTLNTDVKVLRSGAKTLSEDVEFCKAVADLKRQNNVSDTAALEESLENIVSKWPSVLYLTQDELAETIKHALEVVNATNFDDQTCEFMAEGILRTAHNAYVDRVHKIVTLAGTTVKEDAEDKYSEFKNVVNTFFPTLDENNALEMQVYVDLYEALREVYGLAESENDEPVKAETASYLNELAAIIQKEVEPSLEVAQSAAEWLNWLVETNLENKPWTVSNSVHQTVNGDHPDMAKKARHGYTPSSDFSGNWGDSAPVSDGKSYKGAGASEMRSRSWGNIGSKETYPSLSNPYIPKPFGDYTMKGEKGVDKDQGHLSSPHGGDTWPTLQNPYVPKAETPQSYKMNKGKEADLVVDK